MLPGAGLAQDSIPWPRADRLGVTRNPANAKDVRVAFKAVTAAGFNGTTHVLSLRVLTRIGTTETGARCGGHANAVGLRLYFDAAGRAAQVAATF
jgi:hypothetical protein